ncbi:MAG: hypothetical protein P1Q69_18585 [Candidatus Thorarchaeota archaeon]|nr:hypothetical protein [Candidatus Thorarchaeota archaeon]
MSLVLIIIGIFLILELSNVLIMYLKPGSTKANAVGVFTAWEKSKQDPEVHNFVKYLVWWVAGTKLIFISLMVVILFFADPITQSFAIIALLLSTATFYVKLFPLIRSMDRESQLVTKGYSKMIGVMIFIFILAFILAYLVSAGYIVDFIVF